MGFLNSTWFRGERAIEIHINRVRAGALYMYRPVPLDLDMPPFGVIKGTLKPGFMVRVVGLPGFPANTLGHAYIEDPETAGYLGLVVCRACSTARGCKSPTQPDGGEVLAKHKGVVARRGPK